MGIADKMSQIAGNVQAGVKTSSSSLLNWMLKGVTAFFIGLTIAMIGQELLSFGTMAFVFLFLVTAAVILRITAKWTVGYMLIFDLICILMALLLRMYILVAP